MARFRVARDTSLSAAEAWRRLTDWPRHGAHVPLTRVTVEPPGPTRPGTLVVARTGVGRRLGFDDPMEVVRWEPPAGNGLGRCRLEKRGRVVAGWAEIEVRPPGHPPRDGQRDGGPGDGGPRDGGPGDGARDGGARVVWHEEVRLARAGRLAPLLDPPTAWSARLVFGRLLGALLRD